MKWTGQLLAVALAMLFAACESVNCPLETDVACVYGFYTTGRDADGTFYPGSAITIGDTLSITELSQDIVLVNRLIGKSSVSLPVSFYSAADTLELCLADTAGNRVYDVIYVEKQSQPHWDDPSCPVKMWHQLTRVTSTHHVIDTVFIANPTVNYDGLENIKIYFRTGN